MKTVELFRIESNDKQTLGVLRFLDFVCKTLELAWRNNESNKSCIPKGEYPCKWTRSNRLSKLKGEDVYTYEVLSVPDRAGIRIHSANYFFQLLGCISLGDLHKDINIDGYLDVIHSGATVSKFNTLMNKEDFLLVIK